VKQVAPEPEWGFGLEPALQWHWDLGSVKQVAQALEWGFEVERAEEERWELGAVKRLAPELAWGFAPELAWGFETEGVVPQHRELGLAKQKARESTAVASATVEVSVKALHPVADQGEAPCSATQSLRRRSQCSIRCSAGIDLSQPKGHRI
jgi:hypothetical protein